MRSSCKSVVGAVAAAPPAITKDTPAAPNAGKAILRRFRFETRLNFIFIANPHRITTLSAFTGAV